MLLRSPLRVAQLWTFLVGFLLWACVFLAIPGVYTVLRVHCMHTLHARRMNDASLLINCTFMYYLCVQMYS